MFKSVVVSLFALASLVVAQANDPSINSPASLVQCQPIQLTWTATKEPVWISIIPGGNPGAAPLHDFGQQPSGTKSLTWICDYKSGTSMTFQIRDSTGAVAYSANTNVQPSSDSSCVDPNNPNVPPPPGSSGAPTKSTPAAPGPAPAPATSAAASPTKAADVSTSRAPAAATSATPTSSSVAAANAALPGAQLGWTGLVGVLAAFIVV
ncbi:unnamed protein product [Rhizoctonia solani]|uniref:Uncharacterized protein n=1 Tax=Rhizoctonia solani TaxID=456999 RepID=A0A8H3HYM5_9AGAM|nr:unnamed protein product [Rhizoctonia solani]